MGQRYAESGLDHTLNRQLSSNLGRWMTPDPGGVKVVSLSDPQSWDMYVYVTDNPTTLDDPTGLGPNGAYNLEAGEWSDTPMGINSGSDTMLGIYVDSPDSYLSLSELLPVRVVEEASPDPVPAQEQNSNAGHSASGDARATDAYKFDCAHSSTACTGTSTLTTRKRGLINNYTLQRHGVNPDSMQGMIKDPTLISKIMHGGPSWYERVFLHPHHVAPNGSNISVHRDTVNPMEGYGLGLILHLTIDVVPFLVARPWQGSAGTAGPTYTCTMAGGCQ